jgi:glycosyltransferase involved in cell wall biosynthesis
VGYLFALSSEAYAPRPSVLTHDSPNMTPPKVTVVVPTYNRGRFLERAIRSVLAQTESSFEVFVVDDGSPTTEQCEVVARCADERLYYTRLRNKGGPAAARNVGIGLGHGAYIAFLDDDDEWLPHKLERQLEIFESAPACVGGICTARFTVNAGAGTTHVTRATSEDFAGPLYWNPITTSSLIVRRECFETSGVFDEHLEASSDFEMWLRISLSYRFLYVDEPLVRYHLHDAQLSADYAKKARSLHRILEKHAPFYEQQRKKFSRSVIELGRLYSYSRQFSQARETFWKAIRLNPIAVEGYVRLALLATGIERLKAAVRASRQRGSRSAVSVTHGHEQDHLAAQGLAREDEGGRNG